MSNGMNADERAALVERLRTDLFDAVPDDNDMQNVLAKAADLIEADGKRLALADARLSEIQAVAWDAGLSALWLHLKELGRELNPGYDVGILDNPYRAAMRAKQADYDAAKEAL
jgi:hypothetical protein